MNKVQKVIYKYIIGNKENSRIACAKIDNFMPKSRSNMNLDEQEVKKIKTLRKAIRRINLKRYRVEFRSKDRQHSFIIDCVGTELERYKEICKSVSKEYDSAFCYYREFPLTKSKKIYF